MLAMASAFFALAIATVWPPVIATIEPKQIDAISWRFHRRAVRVAQQHAAETWERPVLGYRDKGRADETDR